MQYKCDVCHDSGSKNQTGDYLDCPACDMPHTRKALNDFVKSLGPTHPEDIALAIHQRALAMGMSASVEDTLNEMQPGGALHMPQEPVAHLKFWAAQSWSGNGNHDIDCGEGLEVCEPGEIGADGLPAFPVFMHAIPGALAMAPKQEPEPSLLWDAEDPEDGTHASSAADFARNYAEAAMSKGEVLDVSVLTAVHSRTRTMRIKVKDVDDGEWLEWEWLGGATPAAANGALTDEQVHQGVMALLGCTSSEVEDYSAKLYEGYANDVRRVHAALSGAKGN